jgi:hypothetical protein
MKITYYGQDPSYFSYLEKVIDILEDFDFIPTTITCVYDVCIHLVLNNT